MRTIGIHVPKEGRLSVFDLVELWRMDADGLYQRVTDTSPQPARSGSRGFVVGTATYSVQGLELPFEYNGTRFTIQFPAGPPLTEVQLASFINTSNTAIRMVPGEGGVCIETTAVGSLVTLLFPASDAAQILGLVQDELLRGKDAHPRLRQDADTYLAADPTPPTPETRYFYRLSSSYNPLVHSSFSQPFLGGETAQTCVMELTLEHATGEPREGAEVLIYTDAMFDSGGKAIPPMILKGVTDASGYISFRLRRGLTATVVVAVTSWVHRFQVPVDTRLTSFNPLDPIYALQDDAFGVKRSIYLPARTSP